MEDYMKKLMGFILLLLLAGCVTTGPMEDRIVKLEKQVARLQMTGASETGASFRPFRAIDGGTAGCLDYLDGGSIAIGDAAFVSLYAVSGYGDSLLTYVYRDFGAEVTQSLPWIVKPETNPSANYAWSLSSSSIAVPKVTAGNLDLDTSITTGGVAIVRSGVIVINSSGTIKLPSAASVGYGTTLCIYVTDTDVACTIDVNASDLINLHGTPLTAGYSIDSPGNEGDFICLIASDDANGDVAGTADGWITLGYGKVVWVDGGET